MVDSHHLKNRVAQRSAHTTIAGISLSWLGLHGDDDLNFPSVAMLLELPNNNLCFVFLLLSVGSTHGNIS
jgi:hypothetical protein